MSQPTAPPPVERFQFNIANVQVCRQCGCNDLMACRHPDLGDCWWAEPAAGTLGPLCSHCAAELAGTVDTADVTRPWQQNDDYLAF